MFLSDSSPKATPTRGRITQLRLILAGASWRERLLACAGAAFGVAVTGLICGLLTGKGLHLPLLVAPMGASALLLFSVPTSPMAQPWPIIGGNVISAFTGLVVASFVSEPPIAAALSVGFSIAAMSTLRCLHPPGGASALAAALGGPVVASYGIAFAFVPVGLNALVLTIIGFLFHRLAGHSYPHRADMVNVHGTKDAAPLERVGPDVADIDGALKDIGESFDIDRNDLIQILRRAELHSLRRNHREISCADIMSRDVIWIRTDASPHDARRLLLLHNVRALPVMDSDERLVGFVGLRELGADRRSIPDVMKPASRARYDEPAIELMARLTDGSHHAVAITGQDEKLAGIVTQTDLLAAMPRILSSNNIANLCSPGT